MQNTQELGLSQNVGSAIMPEVINNQVDARSVHEALQVPSDFSHWWKRRVDEFGFIEGEDFSSCVTKTALGRNRIDFIVSLDMAKELAMVERNEMGRKMRRYFIECEKRLASSGGLHPPSQGHIPTSTLLKLQEINAGVISELRAQQERIAQLESQVAAGEDYQAIAQYVLERYYIALSAPQLSFISKRCLQESAIRRLPVGDELPAASRHRRRIFSQIVLGACVPPIVERWENTGKISSVKGGVV